jgi:hypothetical protein
MKLKRDDAATKQVLELGSQKVALLETISNWTLEECRQAEEWASANFYHASDNTVDVPACPPHVAALPDQPAVAEGPLRGTGRTTRQMTEAPMCSVFVWCNHYLWYPRMLAKRLDRLDLEIVAPEWVTEGRWQGRRFPAIVIDHALGVHTRKPRMFNALLQKAMARTW